VWFQKFEDTDDFGNRIEREYLMTTGFLWTEQYEECKVAVEEGRPHSMELDENTLDGHWSTNNKTGMDFFIINDAIFSKLCILGEDVEPCFEGSTVEAPKVSSSFSLVNDEFKQTLYTMMQELKFALEGGQNMEEENVIVNDVQPEVETEVVETPVVEEEVIETPAVEEENTEVDNSEQVDLTENQDSIEVQSNENTFAKKEDEDKEDDKEEEKSESEEQKDEEEKEDSNDEEKEDEEDEKKKYSLLEESYNELQAKFSELEANYNKLVEFKNQIDNEKKDALINSFYMLSDEDKKDVIENKANYSLDDIEAKLSVICVRKKVNFDLDNTSKNDVEVEEKTITTFNLSDGESSTPAWISALRNTQNNRK
jgi:hypothetical protein